MAEFSSVTTARKYFIKQFHRFKELLFLLAKLLHCKTCSYVVIHSIRRLRLGANFKIALRIKLQDDNSSTLLSKGDTSDLQFVTDLLGKYGKTVIKIVS